MNSVNTEKVSEQTDERRFEFWVSVFIAVLFVIQLFRWLSGGGHWDELLVYIVLLMIQLTKYFQLKGLIKLCAQVIAWGLAAVIVVMLFVRW
jgi:hypothetical protein